MSIMRICLLCREKNEGRVAMKESPARSEVAVCDLCGLLRRAVHVGVDPDTRSKLREFDCECPQSWAPDGTHYPECPTSKRAAAAAELVQKQAKTVWTERAEMLEAGKSSVKEARETARPRFISGLTFMNHLEQAGVIPKNCQRVVIDASWDGACKVYYECVGDANLLKVDFAAAGIKVEQKPTPPQPKVSDLDKAIAETWFTTLSDKDKMITEVEGSLSHLVERNRLDWIRHDGYPGKRFLICPCHKVSAYYLPDIREVRVTKHGLETHGDVIEAMAAAEMERAAAKYHERAVVEQGDPVFCPVCQWKGTASLAKSVGLGMLCCPQCKKTQPVHRRVGDQLSPDEFSPDCPVWCSACGWTGTASMTEGNWCCPKCPSGRQPVNRGVKDRPKLSEGLGGDLPVPDNFTDATVTFRKEDKSDGPAKG
jgi:hypothetical protein